MTDKERIAELEKRVERAEAGYRDMEEEQAAILPEDWSLKDWAAVQRKRIAALEAEVAEYDVLIALQHDRTVEADREWQEATGQHDVWPDLGELIDWLRGDRDRLRAALEHASRRLCHNIDCDCEPDTVKCDCKFADPWRCARDQHLPRTTCICDCHAENRRVFAADLAALKEAERE